MMIRFAKTTLLSTLMPITFVGGGVREASASKFMPSATLYRSYSYLFSSDGCAGKSKCSFSL